jgi:hypothetical protein
MLSPAFERGTVGLPHGQLGRPGGEARRVANERGPSAERDERLLAGLGEALGVVGRRRHHGSGRSERSGRTTTTCPKEAVERIELAPERARFSGEAERTSGSAGGERCRRGRVVLADPVLPLEPVLDHPRVDRSEDHGPAARADRRGQTLGVSRGEDQVGARRRLLEHLEDVVGGVLREAIGASDHGHPASTRVSGE